MMNTSKRYFACDFETTVYEGQTSTEVWASACVELNTEEVLIFHSIEEQFNFFKSLKCNIVAYYHNLKFDGSFWLDYLIIQKGFKQAYSQPDKEDKNSIFFLKNKDMLNNSVKYSISNRGQWYTITIKVGNHIIELRDSLKLLPFSINAIGKSFGTKHKKLTMEYTGYRYAGCNITEEEQKYIANDVLVLKEALEIMFDQGHNKLTIGACCLSEYKALCKVSLNPNIGNYDEMFPNLYQKSIEPDVYGSPTIGDYIRKSYKGGWCYVVKGKENKIYGKGITADVNSLYPSVMSSESGSKYPVGYPFFWKGDFIPTEAIADNKYFFIRIKTRFYIKEGYLPFIQLKGNFLYRQTEMLESSDVYDYDDKQYKSVTIDKNGNINDTRITMTMTMTDYFLFREHYNVEEFEILDGCWFFARTGIFDDYIEKYKKIKTESTGALRTLAKLFLNNLYGKMAAGTNSSFKVACVKEDESIGFFEVEQHEKTPGYIPVGSAITSYARNFTIRAAQKNYHGKENRGFIYADTDSIHCDLSAEELVDIPVHPTAFCHWKLESSWDTAVFIRQKTYIEHVTHEDLEPVEHPYYNIKCAGLPKKCKDLFLASLTGDIKERSEYTDEDKRFLFDENGNLIHRGLDKFNLGITIPGKLIPKRIKGGTLLVETTYQMR